jgi:hypothetical protein
MPFFCNHRIFSHLLILLPLLFTPSFPAPLPPPSVHVPSPQYILVNKALGAADPLGWSPYTSHVTCRTSHVTRHTSHVSRHTSPLSPIPQDGPRPTQIQSPKRHSTTSSTPSAPAVRPRVAWASACSCPCSSPPPPPSPPSCKSCFPCARRTMCPSHSLLMPSSSGSVSSRSHHKAQHLL